MNAELSIRVTPLLGIIQMQMEVEEYWAFQDRLIEAEDFDSLSTEDQDIITSIEESL